jgi:hypothetical protein
MPQGMKIHSVASFTVVAIVHARPNFWSPNIVPFPVSVICCVTIYHGTPNCVRSFMQINSM